MGKSATKIRSKEEIAIAVARLKENKEKTATFNFFGENNHDKIDTMIDVISENRSEDYVYSNYSSHFEDGKEDADGHSKWQSAMIALEYMRGEWELKDLLYPEK